ncbi:MAG: leucine-rich repeat domain-containing protein [Tannerellaceae bacterium]|jgi:hypothetical protein|nr:leucine-rich repeat domain-containing protein [Tannerellaceae bacterium]
MKKVAFLALCISLVTSLQVVSEEEYLSVYFETDNGVGTLMGFKVVADGEVELVAFNDPLLGHSIYDGEVLVPSRVEREGTPDGTVIYQVKGIGRGVFRGCTELKKLIIEGEVEYIDTAFGGCVGLEEVVLLKGERPLSGRSKAFAGTGLKVLWMQRDVEINSSPFYEASQLEKLIIGKDVTMIGAKAFVGCTRLKEIEIEAATDTLRFGLPLALASCPLEKVYVGRNLLFDGGSPFRDKTMLTNIEFGTDVTSIAERMFMNSTRLYRLTIPGGVKTIEVGAFQDCKMLSEVTLAESVTEIKGEAFAGCTNMRRIVCLRALPPENVLAIAFDGIDRNNCELVVPTGSTELYASAPVWSSFTHIVAARGNAVLSPTIDSDNNSVDVYTLSGRFIGHYPDGLPVTFSKGVYLIRNAQGVSKVEICKE